MRILEIKRNENYQSQKHMFEKPDVSIQNLHALVVECGSAFFISSPNVLGVL